MGATWRPGWRLVPFCGWRCSHPGSPTGASGKVEPFLSLVWSGTGGVERGLRRLWTWERPRPARDPAAQWRRRPKSTNPFTRAQEEDWRRRNKTVLTYVAAAAVGMLGASYAAVPLYRLYCQVGGGALGRGEERRRSSNAATLERGAWLESCRRSCIKEETGSKQ